jgi:hypothetical protein
MLSTPINHRLATEHLADLRRAGDRHRRNARHPQPIQSGLSPTPAVVLRLAHADDARLVHRLAELDDAAALEGPVLIALVDGRAVAALALRDERVVADPFVLTGEAVALLRIRAGHLSRGRPRRRLRTVLRPRFA